jgi:3-dehydroquinate synthase
MKLTLQLPETPSRTSDIIIEDGPFVRYPEFLKPYIGKRLDYWIWDSRVWRLWQNGVKEGGWPDLDSGRVVLFSAMEANKRLFALEELAGKLIGAGADRGSVLVAVGGGVTGDVVGLLASLFMRGIPHCQIPTTLLAQVDSSIGGKTGVDLPEGKNLIGTFHQPLATWMHPRFLETLPYEGLRQGMAEVIKTAMIGDEVLWKYLESHSFSIRRREREALERVITACCILKTRVVEMDEKESGLRRVLNLGHTVGHALERLSEYQLPHGEAVAIGLVVAAKISVRMGELPQEDLDRLVRLCIAWDLPVQLPGDTDPDAVVYALMTDKKRIGSRLHFILPVSIGKVRECSDLDLTLLKDVLSSLRGGKVSRFPLSRD